MIDDKLTKAERLRLEALNQAGQSLGGPVQGAKLDEIMSRAKVFEHYIKTGNDKTKQ